MECHESLMQRRRMKASTILTGDPAICATCIKCETKIVNPTYSRPLQGMFCTPCRESLMRRLRMKALTKGLITKDKELPALPSEPRHKKILHSHKFFSVSFSW